jgi:hypothetical protein
MLPTAPDILPTDAILQQTSLPQVPRYVSEVFEAAPVGVRAQLIETLMRPMGVLGLVAVAGGAFAAVRQRNGWQHLRVTLDDAARISTDQVQDLAAYLMQAAPEVFGQIADLLAAQPMLVSSLSTVLLLHALRRVGSVTRSP